MMTSEEMIAVIKAYQNGEKIQFLDKNDCFAEWIDTDDPSFNFLDFDYQIKPVELYKPYDNCNELIEDFKKTYNKYGGWTGKSNPMYCPLIWIKKKSCCISYLITGFLYKAVVLLNNPTDLSFLFENFTYLDGSPIGKRV